ncbi:MAG: hypothetical protein LAO79_26120 [Acidobacteriia bacterium]|nr:hypothetical protein [Terriglobia bacterium]
MLRSFAASPTGRIALALLLAGTVRAAAPNWIEHKDPQGFVVKHPPGWVVETPEKSMVVVHDASGNFEAIAYGFLARPEVTSRQWLEQRLAQKFAGHFPQAKLDAVAARGQNVSTVLLRYGSGFGEGRASVLCALSGGAGMMFAIAAPAFRFDDRKADLVEILRTFSVTGGGSGRGGSGRGGDASGVEWVRWSDPVEGAYSLEAPKGWKIEGGTSRRSAVDIKQWNRLTSPDGKTQIFQGDPGIPSMYMVPTQMMAQLGQREGQPSAPGSTVFILRFQPGVVYAQSWAQKIAGGAVQVKDQKERHDFEEMMRKFYPSTAVAQQVWSYGDVSFVTARGQAGYSLAGTSLTTVAGMSSWYVALLDGFVTPAEQSAQTFAVAMHVLSSTQANPQWQAAQQKTTAEVSRITHETAEYVSKIQSDSYWNRQKVQDRTNRNFDDSIRGVQRVVDPDTGREYEAVAGSNYYYRVHGTDRVVGTNSASTPNIDVTLLIPVK